jgi:hypothetical protein
MHAPSPSIFCHSLVSFSFPLFFFLVLLGRSFYGQPGQTGWATKPLLIKQPKPSTHQHTPQWYVLLTRLFLLLSLTDGFQSTIVE